MREVSSKYGSVQACNTWDINLESRSGVFGRCKLDLK